MSDATPPNPRKLKAPPRESGSTILVVLGILAITSLAVGAALYQARHRFWTGHHSARWVQAKHAAEGGVEMALVSAHTNSWSADGWAGTPGATALTKTYILSSGVTSALPVRAKVTVDLIPMAGTQWMRIRSTGEAALSRATLSAGLDGRDVMLRKLSLRQDRNTGASVGAEPMATRTVEVLAAPKPLTPFKYFFATKQKIFFQRNNYVDSYDSSDPAKSSFTTFGTYGVYSWSKRQGNGDLGTLDATESNFNNAYIFGDILTPQGTVAGVTNLYGTVGRDFATEFPPEAAPNWTIVTQNHGIVDNVSKTIVGGTKDSPTRHKFTSIQLNSANRAILIQKPAGQTESWVELWITGDVQIDGQNSNGIKLDPGVHATIHVGGNVQINAKNGGYGIDNGSKLSENLIVRAYGGSAADIKTFTLGNLDFWGVMSAPWTRVTFNTAGNNIHGSFLAYQLDTTDGTYLHYDEALQKLQLGTSTGWQVRSFVELVR